MSSSSNSLPLVAVVLPVYNVAPYIEQCLNSILEQTYTNFLVFAIDDGSTDDSGKLLDSIKTKDERFLVTHKTNGGVSSARNLALEQIQKFHSVEYICFIDSDDYLSKDYLAIFVSYLSRNDCDYGVCSFKTFNKFGFYSINGSIPESSILTTDDIAAQFFHISIQTGRGVKPNSTSSLFLNNRFFKYSKIKQFRFNESLKACEDQDYFIRIIPSLKRGVLIPQVLYFYRRRLSSLSNGINAKNFDLKVYSLLYSQRKSFIRSIRIGIQTEYLNHLFQDLFTNMSDPQPLRIKKEKFAHCLSIINQDFEFPFNDSINTKINVVREGFFFTLIWSSIRSKLKRIRNNSREVKFYP